VTALCVRVQVEASRLAQCGESAGASLVLAVRQTAHVASAAGPSTLAECECNEERPKPRHAAIAATSKIFGIRIGMPDNYAKRRAPSSAVARLRGAPLLRATTIWNGHSAGSLAAAPQDILGLGRSTSNAPDVVVCQNSADQKRSKNRHVSGAPELFKSADFGVASGLVSADG
jgi:hypothetical protein